MTRPRQFNTDNLPDWFAPDLKHKVEGLDGEPADFRVAQAARRVVVAGRKMWEINAGARNVRVPPVGRSRHNEGARTGAGVLGGMATAFAAISAGFHIGNEDVGSAITDGGLPTALGLTAAVLSNQSRNLDRGGRAGVAVLAAGSTVYAVNEVTTAFNESSPADGMSGAGAAAAAAGLALAAWAAITPEPLATSRVLDVVEAIGTPESRAMLSEWRTATSDWYEVRDAYGLPNATVPYDWPELILNAINAEELRLRKDVALPPAPGPSQDFGL